VIVDEDAVPYVKKGRSVLAPGVSDADPDISPGDEVVVLSRDGEPIGPGTAKLSGREMRESEYGLSVKLRQKWREIELPSTYDTSGTWDGAVEASMNSLVNHESEAVRFIRRVVGQHPDLPVMVSLSGGKDSLAVLLLVLAAGQYAEDDSRLSSPTLLFLDTGLEFPETIENVRVTAERYGLPLVVADAGDAFWRNVSRFGPPSKDFRWCCKVCKLGPTARTITETYPGGVLSFIGQRAYESTQRSKKPRVWENPWVPGQVGASPIQNWTALHIWLYLFWKRADYNPLYELGFARIGCWLCPASDQADYLEVLDVHPEAKRWTAFLGAYADDRGFTDEWLSYGLWKWKRPPGFVKDLMERKGIAFRRSDGEAHGDHDADEHPGEGSVKGTQLRFLSGEVRPSCTDELTVEGVFTRAIDIERASRLLRILGLTCFDDDTGVVSIGTKLTLTGEGSLSVNAPTEKAVRSFLQAALEVIHRSEECVGCGICIGRCPHGALFLDHRNRVDIVPGSCVHCRKCLGKCPVTDFRDEGDFDN
jgi:phosphoadenosine phosphosulfate reductase